MKDSRYTFKNNKVLVVQRLELLEKRLIKNSDKAKQYSETIKQYAELGHAIKLSATESTITKQYSILHVQPLRNQPKQTEQIQMLEQNLQG